MYILYHQYGLDYVHLHIRIYFSVIFFYLKNIFLAHMASSPPICVKTTT